MMPNIHLSQDPIFIVGYARSGTTLLQALLATQGNLATFPETQFFSSLHIEIREVHKDIEISAVDKILRRINELSGINFELSFIKAIKEKTSSDQIAVKDFFEALVFKLFPEDADPSQRWLEKTPDHGLYLNFISDLYPQAKFAGIVRNPLHAIYSRTRNFPPKTIDLLGLLSNQWVNHIHMFEKFQKQNPDKAILTRYEDLTKDPVKAISKICEFTGLEFRKDFLGNYRKTAESIIQPFEHWKNDVKSSPIIYQRKNKKNNFAARKILRIQFFTQEKMICHGYPIEYQRAQRFYNFFGRPIKSIFEVLRIREIVKFVIKKSRVKVA